MILETIFLTKVLGLYFLVAGLALIYNREKLIRIISLIDWHNSLLPFIVGVGNLFLGLIIVIGHYPTLINLIGWAMLLKAVLCLFNFNEIPYILKKYNHSSILIFHGILSLILGFILIFSGFFG